MSDGWGSHTEQLHDIYEQLVGINWALRHPEEFTSNEADELRTKLRHVTADRDELLRRQKAAQEALEG